MVIDDYQDIANPYYNLFFCDLKTQEDKAHFLKAFNQQKLTTVLEQMVDLFSENPLKSKAIYEYCQSNFNGSKSDDLIDRLTEYQRSFYLTTYIFDAHTGSTPKSYYWRLLESRNRSFQVLLDLNNEKYFENNFIEAFGKQIRNAIPGMTKEDLIRLKIMRATFEAHD